MSSSSSSESPATRVSVATTCSRTSACHLGHISLMINRTLIGDARVTVNVRPVPCLASLRFFCGHEAPGLMETKATPMAQREHVPCLLEVSPLHMLKQPAGFWMECSPAYPPDIVF